MKSNVIRLRVTAQDHERLKERAAKHNKTLSNYIRDALANSDDNPTAHSPQSEKPSATPRNRWTCACGQTNFTVACTRCHNIEPV